VSIRYELKPLDEETVSAYVAHRLTIAGGSARVAFTAKALRVLHRLSGGIPRLINLICDRALLAGYSVQTDRITPDMVRHAANSLELQPSFRPRWQWLRSWSALAAGAAVVLLASASGVGLATWLYQRFDVDAVQAKTRVESDAVSNAAVVTVSRELPASSSLTILVGSFQEDQQSQGGVAALTEWLEAAGYAVYYEHVDTGGGGGRWLRVMAGAYDDPETAAREAERLNAAAPGLDARVIAAAAQGTTG
jgi:general secretion pathway protein A